MDKILRGDEIKRPVIFFDLGNTLLYYQGDRVVIELEAYHALARALSAQGLEFPTKKFLKRFQHVMENYYHRRSTTLIEETTVQQLVSVLSEFGYQNVPFLVLRKALDAMYRITEEYWQLDPESHACLSQLRSTGFQIGLISNASDAPNVFRLLRLHHLHSYFSAILISSIIGYRKPHRRIFEAALATCPGIAARDIFMVGDLISTDITGGVQSGMRTIWLSKHADLQEEPEPDAQIRPDQIFPSLSMLTAWLVDQYSQ